jgi:hypothetical protein
MMREPEPVFLRPYLLSTQVERDVSFIGGVPRLSPDCQLPACTLCGSQLAFFLQIALPDNHPWGGRSVAVFACVECEDYDFVIPDMKYGREKESIPKQFLEEYQKNFRFLVFKTDTARMRSDYNVRVAYQRMTAVSTDHATLNDVQVGGDPSWRIDDEFFPGTCEGDPFVLLFQFPRGISFEIVDDAPRQIHLDITGNPCRSTEGSYDLFVANEIYAFGTLAPGYRGVYVVVQR